MILYINQYNEIKDVNATKDTTLTPIEIDDNGYNPFKNWSVAKICCHRVELKDGKYNGFSPYVDSRIIDHIDNLAKSNETNASDITNIQLAICDIYEATL